MTSPLDSAGDSAGLPALPDYSEVPAGGFALAPAESFAAAMDKAALPLLAAGPPASGMPAPTMSIVEDSAKDLFQLAETSDGKGDGLPDDAMLANASVPFPWFMDSHSLPGTSEIPRGGDGSSPPAANARVSFGDEPSPPLVGRSVSGPSVVASLSKGSLAEGQAPAAEAPTPSVSRGGDGPSPPAGAERVAEGDEPSPPPGSPPVRRQSTVASLVSRPEPLSRISAPAAFPILPSTGQRLPDGSDSRGSSESAWSAVIAKDTPELLPAPPRAEAGLVLPDNAANKGVADSRAATRTTSLPAQAAQLPSSKTGAMQEINQDGMPDAKSCAQVKTADNMNQFARQTMQKLPLEAEAPKLIVAGRAAGESGAESPSLTALASLPFSLSENANGTPANQGAVRESSPASGPAVERTQQLLTAKVVELKQLSATTMTVAIRPDRQTELYLHLRLNGDQVEIHARCETGDAGRWTADWAQLQHNLAAQGIRLAPLNDPIPHDLPPASGSLASPSHFSQNSSDRQPPSSRPPAEPAAEPARIPAWPESTHPQPPKPVRYDADHWEFWA